MSKIRKHRGKNLSLKIPKEKEVLHPRSFNIPLNKSNSDRITVSYSINRNNEPKIIENISYEIYVDDNWISLVRYDDHAGIGQLHRHIRMSLQNQNEVQSNDNIKKYKNKKYELTWIINDLKRNHLIYRTKFCKNSGIDLY